MIRKPEIRSFLTPVVKAELEGRAMTQFWKGKAMEWEPYNIEASTIQDIDGKKPRRRTRNQ